MKVWRLFVALPLMGGLEIPAQFQSRENSGPRDPGRSRVSSRTSRTGW